MKGILESISDFCKSRNKGPAYLNGGNKTPRVNFIIELLKNN